MLFCESESGEGAWRPRTTVGECETVARCGAGTFATVVVVAIADLERFVVICSGRIGDRGGENGPDVIGIESSRLSRGQQMFYLQYSKHVSSAPLVAQRLGADGQSTTTSHA